MNCSLPQSHSGLAIAVIDGLHLTAKDLCPIIISVLLPNTAADRAIPSGMKKKNSLNTTDF